MTHRTETLDAVLTSCSGNSSHREWRLCCAVARRCALTFLAAATLAQPALAANSAAEASARLLAQVEPRIKAIYETDEFHMRSFDATWLPDGSGYLKLETPDGASAAEIARYDSASGQRTVAVAGEKLLVPGTSERLRIHGFVCSPTGKRFAYPNRDHGLHEGNGTEVHLRMLIIRYLIEHLPPGPR